MEPPRLIDGRYRIVGELGRGGTGVVYEAVDERLERRVAVKLLHMPDSETGQARRILLHEARAAARLRHPHAVTVHEVSPDTGTDPPYLVMELVAGWSLHERVRRHGPLPPHRAAAIGTQLADCLRAAHTAGLIHRDLKPSNVIITDQGTAKLTDFGIAALPTNQQITLWGTVIGSPPYLSPEQSTGTEPTPASDWWSLGATLYFAVEGHPPFERPNALATLTAVRQDPPAPMRRAGKLAPLLHALLTKDPTHRPTADHVLATLTTLTALTEPAAPTEPAERPPATPAPPPPPAHTPRRQTPLLAAAAAVVVLGGGTAAVALAHPWRTAAHHTAAPPTGSPTPPATSGAPAGDRVRWQGVLSFDTHGVYLDPVPPRAGDANSIPDLGTTPGNGGVGGLGAEDDLSSIVAWPGAGMPTRQRCADLLRAAGPHSIGLVPAPPGTAACVHTQQGRTAYVEVNAFDGERCSASVIVWEN